MIQITTIPASTATSQQLVVEITEQLCKRVCVNAGRTISGTVQFSVGTPTVVNGVAITPIVATGSMVIAGGCGDCECGNTRHFSEVFYVPFTATTTNAVSVVPGASSIVEFIDVTCCHTTKAKLTTTITVAIA